MIEKNKGSVILLSGDRNQN